MIHKPKNSNYAAIVTQVMKTVPLENCDYVQGAIILGNQVIVGKDVKEGDVGVYFPLECALSPVFLKNNNLYRQNNLNLDNTKKGYFEENGRVRAVKFRGLHKSEGLFMPLTCLNFTNFDIEKFQIGDEFDSLNNIPICEKYVIKSSSKSFGNSEPRRKKGKKINISDQFAFHKTTSQLYKNIHLFKPDQIISISYKMHGTSGISSRVLWDRKLSFVEKVLKFFKIPIVDREYKTVYSSRSVIKNLENSSDNHFYKVDIWGYAHHRVILPALKDGMTIYYEIVGYLPSGGYIQRNYDYGYVIPENNEAYEHGKHYGVYVYRITQTSESGDVLEFSTLQIQDYCRKYGLKVVPELFYGNISDFSDERMTLKNWQQKLFENLKSTFTEKECFMCVNKVPEEGCVVRIENLNFDAFKLKSNAFYMLETKQKDESVVDIEENN